MKDHPTLQEQRAANLDVGDGPHPDTPGQDMSEAIRLAIRRTGTALKADRTAATKRVHRKK